MAGLVCEQVRASYNSTEVLHGIDLSVSPGEWVAVIGPNGSGKSTLLRSIAGTASAAGRVTIAGRRLGELSRKEISRAVAMVPQHPVVPPGVSVVDYVLLGRTPHLPPWSFETAADVRVVERVLGELDLNELRDRSLTSLSGGEFQRAVLGRALAQEPQVLLLDEPTTALDVGHAQQVLQLVEERCKAQGLTVLSAMHDLTLAGQFCDRLLLLDQGCVVAEGAAREVLTAELLAAHYDANVVILEGPAGEPVVVPRR
jgi:iron complex transport system ATP-binding protein